MHCKTSCQFNLAHELKRDKTVLNGTEMTETVLCCKKNLETDGYVETEA